MCVLTTKIINAYRQALEILSQRRKVTEAELLISLQLGINAFNMIKRMLKQRPDISFRYGVFYYEGEKNEYAH